MTGKCLAATCLVVALVWLAPANSAAQAQAAAFRRPGAVPHDVG